MWKIRFRRGTCFWNMTECTRAERRLIVLMVSVIIHNDCVMWESSERPQLALTLLPHYTEKPSNITSRDERRWLLSQLIQHQTLTQSLWQKYKTKSPSLRNLHYWCSNQFSSDILDGIKLQQQTESWKDN